MKKILCVLMAMVLIFCIAAVPAFAEGVTPITGPVDVLAEYAWIIFAVFVCLIAAGVTIYTFIKTPRDEQIEKLKEWLLWAVVEAEKELGSKTGEIKLRRVYDLFVTTFPWLARIIKFETFHGFVKEALEKMEQLIIENKQIAAYIKAGKE